MSHLFFKLTGNKKSIEKMYMFLLLPLLIPSIGVAESTSMSDFEACMYYVGESKNYVNADWNEKEMQIICVELLNNGLILIEREDQRNIQIYFKNVNESVSIPLNYVTVPSLE